MFIIMTSAPGWTASLQEMRNDRRKFENNTPDTPEPQQPGVPPEGKKWECCTACNGLGKVLVDDVPEIKRYYYYPYCTMRHTLSIDGALGLDGY